jgi:hypothetical protein
MPLSRCVTWDVFPCITPSGARTILPTFQHFKELFKKHLSYSTNISRNNSAFYMHTAERCAHNFAYIHCKCAKDYLNEGRPEVNRRRQHRLYSNTSILVFVQAGLAQDKRKKIQGNADGLWQCYECVTWVVLMALAVLQMCHAGGVTGSGSVTNVSRGWCYWHWQCYKWVTRVVLLALVVYQMCHAGGVTGAGSVTNVSRGWCSWHWQCYKFVTLVVLLALAVLQMGHAGGVAGSGSVTNLSRWWCCWLWQCYKCVTRVVLLALAVYQMCHVGGVAGAVSVTHVSRGWC